MTYSAFTRVYEVVCVCLLIILPSSCKQTTDQDTPTPASTTSATIKLQSLPPGETGVTFANTIQDEGRINIFTWHFIYNGAGVAAGDINNDGLPDLYFTGNQVPDKLYLNKGNFQFEDITSNADISPTIWSSGVTMADVNADGLLDIYVCRNSPTGNPENNRNKLYINQGNNRFSEQAAAYGIADIGFSTQANFFDADQDGDLDMYLVNQPFDEFARLVNKPEVVASYPVTDRFFFFENGKFVDRIEQMGMQDARYGLNATIGDFDRNGWTDIYVCNDYHHGDFLYLNTGGTFTESIRTHTGHTSFYSMGSDMGDINADGWPDLFTLDMAYEEHFRSKTNMGSMDVNWFWSLVKEGHHYQYMQNVLQVNDGNGYFADMAQIGGISKSDWSFATLFADLDHDADQDIIVTNGVYRDMRNNDFNKMVKDKYKGMVGPDNYLEVLHNLPSTPISNIIYTNSGDFRFSKLPAENGFAEKGFSHGLAYADLNNDGLLDLVVNNQNAPASIYKNVSETDGNYITLHLEGPGKNVDGLGCSAIVHAGGKSYFNTVQTTRGYFSSVEPLIHVGLGTAAIDSIEIMWDHKSMTVLHDVKANQKLHVHYAKEKKIPFRSMDSSGMPASIMSLEGFTHREVSYNDYKQQVLLPYKLSQNGPYISVGDVNGDQLEDFFVGGAAGFAGSVFTQQANGTFVLLQSFDTDKAAEDMESVMVDVDNDQDLDLFVTSGSNEFEDGHPLLQPRLYINNGKGQFSKAAPGTIPDARINGQCVELIDADGDKDMDMFIGGRLTGGQYAVSPDSYLWINANGKFTDETKKRASFLQGMGMVTDAVAQDVDQDGDSDLLVVGEWMAPTWMINDGSGNFTSKTIEAAGTGLWWTVDAADFDKDGDIDIIAGNLGWNNKFGGAGGTKLEVYANDFDQSGDYDVVLASMKNEKLVPVRGRECTSQEMPFILDKFPTYESYAKAQLQDIYTPQQLSHSVHKKLSTMSSLYLQNDGNGNWTAKPLPLLCQASPLKAVCVQDVNGDGNMDFMYAGNHFPTEVETARYDGLYPGVCTGDGRGNFTCKTLTSHGQRSLIDARDLKAIASPSQGTQYLVGVNDGPVQIITLSKN